MDGEDMNRVHLIQAIEVCEIFNLNTGSVYDKVHKGHTFGIFLTAWPEEGAYDYHQN